MYNVLTVMRMRGAGTENVTTGKKLREEDPGVGREK